LDTYLAAAELTVAALFARALTGRASWEPCARNLGKYTGRLVTITVNRKAADRVANGHPWIFASDIVNKHEAEPGDTVKVAVANRNGAAGKPLGTAHYSSTSQIALRMLSDSAQPIDHAFFVRRLKGAIAHRDRVVENSNACRLVFSEADLLPGLIVDRYGDYLVMQTLSQGMDRSRDLIADCLRELLAPAGIFARNDASVRKLENLPLESTVLSGEIPERVPVEMNGLRFDADLRRGQKTGVYLDQRENYVAAAQFARGRVLDCFTSSGGFALHSARGGFAPHCARNVESVEAIDSSEHAIATAEANARANGIDNIQFRQADVFEFLSAINKSYSTIILDPPAFAKSRRSLDDAARGYKEINLRALRLLEPGGVLVTCSCSHHFSEAALLEVVAAAALDCGKTLRVLDRRTQAADHPILLTVPETLYLKCLILEVLAP
jgi:23S rRNA (cytosine1962-C5)-methyltransferase